jgi:prepilin-type N-terminal cleavage/methylation domain-containing protein
MREQIQKQTSAFTLAEVLITLGIIGIVAALTVPTLVADSQKQGYVTALEKMTSVLNSGFRQIMADTGASDIPSTNIVTTSSDTTIDNIAASNVFSILKVCHKGETGCHDKPTYDIHNKYSGWVPSTYYSMIILKDGQMLGMYRPNYPNCDHYAGTGAYSGVCLDSAIIDTNGPKPPNVFGRDIFRFTINKVGQVLPVGAQNCDTSYWGTWDDAASLRNCTNSTGDGATCFGRIMQDGWQMKY